MIDCIAAVKALAKQVIEAGLWAGTLGEILYCSATDTWSRLAGNTTTTRKFLRQTGNGAVSAAPAWDTLVAGDIPDISATYQPLDSDLTAIAALSTTSFGRSLLTQADAATARTTLGAGTGSGDALVANPLSQFASTTSAQLAGVVSDETGSGALVFATSPALVTPALGTPASGVLTNCTGTASGLTAGAVTVADAGGDTTTWVLLGTSQTGSLSPATDAGLTYNATTNALTATTFVGALTGNADTATTAATLSGATQGDIFAFAAAYG